MDLHPDKNKGCINKEQVEEKFKSYLENIAKYVTAKNLKQKMKQDKTNTINIGMKKVKDMTEQVRREEKLRGSKKIKNK